MLSISASSSVLVPGTYSRNASKSPWRRHRVFCLSSDDTRNSNPTSGGEEYEKEGNPKNGRISEDLEAQVARMLEDMESQALLKDLNAAVERVAQAKKELKALELEEQQRAQNTILDADSMVEECQRDVFQAELKVRDAEVALIRARAGNSIWGLTWEEQDGIDVDAERLESAKVAAVSALVGTIAGVPFFAAASLDGWELAVSAGFVFVSCALFGLTYRYAIRKDLDNTQLKAGCVAAFSLVRGLGQLESSGLLLRLLQSGEPSELLQGCLLAAESISIFGFAAVTLEYSFRQGLLRPFPLRSQE